MALTYKDITLDNFLLKFTYAGDPDPQGKIQLEMPIFLQIASLLKIDMTLTR